MKAKFKTIILVDVQMVEITAAVKYGDEEMPHDFPFRNGDIWNVRVKIDTGEIVGWPVGKSHKLHLTVKDEGAYFLFDESGNRVSSRENDYVPHGLIPGSWGDTIELDISGSGHIANWPARPDLSGFPGFDFE